MCDGGLPPVTSEDDGHILAEVDPACVRRIHLVGVAGTGMAAFAGMLREAGYTVTGSDQNIFPPMSDLLRAWGIPVLTPYSPANLDVVEPDLVIIGNVLRRANAEAAQVRARRLPQMSFPAALGSVFLRNRHPVVVVGTHGKTTVSALMAHVLVAAHRDSSFLLGGVTRNYGAGHRLGQGAHFVLEGDEYDTAYFDKGPKFLHYRPRTAIMTSIEFDHADIYGDLAHYETAFERFVRLLPREGMLVVSAVYPNAVRIARSSVAAVVTYALSAEADYVARDVMLGPDGARFEVLERGLKLGTARLAVGGAHNVENALGVIAAARHLDLSVEEILHGLATFAGVRRRQEVRAEVRGVTVIDDFAHHPTAVCKTIAAIRDTYPDRRLWAVFEPRSNTSRRNIHQEEYGRAFDGAACVRVRIPEPHDMVPPAQQLDVGRLTTGLRARGIDAVGAREVGVLVDDIARSARPGDVVLVMSNGSFGDFVEKLIAAL